MTAPVSAITRGERRLAILEQERKTDTDARQAVWVFLWTLFVFKIATVGLIWYAAGGSAESQVFIYATTWIWLVIPAAAIVGPFLYWRRLRRQRKHRDRLLRSEWMIESGDYQSPGVGPISIGDNQPGAEPPKSG